MNKHIAQEDAIIRARVDPRQMSLFGKEHTQELLSRRLPFFANEDEEAKWWFDNRANVARCIIEESRKQK
jgi:hypothetical protein